jgi:hypothetical protein
MSCSHHTDITSGSNNIKYSVTVTHDIKTSNIPSDIRIPVMVYAGVEDSGAHEQWRHRWCGRVLPVRNVVYIYIYIYIYIERERESEREREWINSRCVIS